MNPSRDSLVGRIFGDYHLLSVLGSGGAGTVYLAAVVEAPEQRVAVKVLTPPPQSAPADLAECKARFEREAKALRLLRHPHILTLLGSGEDEESGLAYMVLPYMAGGTLNSRLAQGSLPLEDTGRYATQIADALDYAHQQGVVHRDLKPGNVLLDERGEVSLADFGIAKVFDTAGTTMVTLTSTGQIMGTADYMSPEQAQGQDVTAASDVYSFGMLLYHLVTGQVAFEGKSLTQVLLQIATTPPIPPRRLRPTLPAPAEAAILRALAKQPVDRFTSAGELAQAFTQGLKGAWVPGLRQAATVDAFVPQQTVTAPRERRVPVLTRPPVLIAAVSAIVLFALVGILLLTGVFPGRPGGRSSVLAGESPTATGTHAAATGSPTLTTTPGKSTATVTTGQPGTGGGGQPIPTLAPGQPTFTPLPGQPTFTPTSPPAPPITETAVPTANVTPSGMVSGPDGALWFTEYDGNKIGRITTSGQITQYPIPASACCSPTNITAGPDGALWFTAFGSDKIGRITTSGTITGYALPASIGAKSPYDITTGSDGALWFTEANGAKIGRITTSGAITEFALPVNSNCWGIAAGTDGALWAVDTYFQVLRRMTTSGQLTTYTLPAGSDPWKITSGPDGALWFTDRSLGKIGRMTTDGFLNEFSLPISVSGPKGIASGPDGALWFTEYDWNQLGRITTSGSITEFQIPTASSHPFGIAAGSDSAVWFVEETGNNIGRIAP